jgi:hypothetical protein
VVEWAPAAADTWNSGTGIIYTNTGVKVGVDTATPTGTFEVQSPATKTARHCWSIRRRTHPAIADFQRSGSSKLRSISRDGWESGLNNGDSHALHVGERIP